LGDANPVEAALATALTQASAAAQWDIVARLAGELEARRRARAGTVDLDAERARRGVRR
jgi:predicted lipoprotein